MTIDEPTRRSLYDSLARSLGEDQADALMSLLPQYPLADLATRDDVHSLAIALRGEMALGFGKVDRQFGELRGEMALGFGKVDRQFGELRGEMAELRGEIGKLSGELRAEFSQQVLMLGLLLGASLLTVLGTVLTLGFTGAFA